MQFVLVSQFSSKTMSYFPYLNSPIAHSKSPTDGWAVSYLASAVLMIANKQSEVVKRNITTSLCETTYSFSYVENAEDSE